MVAAANQARREAEERPATGGTPKRGETLNIEGSPPLKTAGASYRLRRIARLKPDVLERYEGGEFPSVDAAYRHAFALGEDIKRVTMAPVFFVAATPPPILLPA